MGQNIVVTGMVLNTMPVGDYDKRITLLTRERGKITAFARGARRQGSQFLAAASPFSFGEFELFEGRNSYSLAKVSVRNYFRELTADLAATYYGFYFLEFADYYCQENNDEREMLKLLYQSMRALASDAYDNRLVRCIFELKAMAVNGEGPGVFSCLQCGKKQDLRYFYTEKGGCLCDSCGKAAAGAKGSHYRGDSFLLETSTLYAMQYIISSRVEKLYTFSVSGSVLKQLMAVIKSCQKRYLNHSFQSLKILEEMSAEQQTGEEWKL